MPRSLRSKVALVFAAVTIVLLVAQALGVRVLAEAQEEKLIAALIDDDMANVVRSYKANPALLPPFDARRKGYVSTADTPPVALPSTVRELPDGIHEIILGGREIHVAIVPFGSARLYRIYNFSAYEKHFKAVIDAVMAGTGIFALLAIWLAFWLSGLLVRQAASLARQVKALKHDGSASISPGKYDEDELVDLVAAFNAFHRRLADMIKREKEFTGNVSHELRTPLTTIRTSCELLAQDPALAGKSRQRLEQIDRACDDMRELVNALLMLAREDSAQQVEPVDIAHLVDTALAACADRLEANEINVIIDLDRGLHLLAHRAALAIVLTNVIDNAVRYTRRGSLRFSYGDGQLRIEDTGCGIAAHALPRVFDRLYRTQPDDAHSRGFGIGLAIVKRVCDRYDWPIELDSEPGRGTCVSLRVPQASPACAGPRAGSTLS